MNESENDIWLQTLRAKPIKKLPVVSQIILAYSSSSCPIFVSRQHLMDHNFHNTKRWCFYALEPVVLVTGLIVLLGAKKGAKPFIKAPFKASGSTLFGFTFFCQPSKERKFKLEWKFSNRKSWQILLLCLAQTPFNFRKEVKSFNFK